MITISKSPLRISFFGGGTDYPAYYEEFPGMVLGATIDKYVYSIALPMADFAENKYRITYRIVEAVDHIDDIKHNVIRATLKNLEYENSLNLAIISDLPGSSGLGSSSSFTVGFIKLIEHLRGRSVTKFDLFKQSVYVEKNLLNENVGIQDQIHASFGGLNLYSFHKSEFSIKPVQMHTEARQVFDKSLCLVYTGVQRHASAAVAEQINNTKEKTISNELSHLVELCKEANLLLHNHDGEFLLREFGRLLNEGWNTKRKLSRGISLPVIDDIYDTAIQLGAYGGKLCGAGGGGFLLFLASDSVKKKIAEKFGIKNFVDISLEDSGAQIITR